MPNRVEYVSNANVIETDFVVKGRVRFIYDWGTVEILCGAMGKADFCHGFSVRKNARNYIKYEMGKQDLKVVIDGDEIPLYIPARLPEWPLMAEIMHFLRFCNGDVNDLGFMAPSLGLNTVKLTCLAEQAIINQTGVDVD